MKINRERVIEMRKILSVLFVICIVFTLCSCGQQAESETVPEYDLDIGEVDYKGAEFVFAQRNEEHSTGDEYFGYVVNTEFSDLAVRRIKEVEEKLHVKITVDLSGGDIGYLVPATTISGLVPFDALQTASNPMASLARAGYLYDITVLSDIMDYLNAAKWGTKEDLKPLCWNGGLFGVIPAAWPMLKYRSVDGAVVVNETIIGYLQETDPRELCERDEWTWRKFEELMPVYNHINDAGDEVMALETTVHWLFRTMHTTNGVPVVVKDESGDYQLSLHSSADTFEAMQTAWNWTFGEYSSYVNVNTGDWKVLLQNFIDGRSVVTIMNGTDLCGSENSIAFNMDNFGVVPFPHGPNGSRANTGATITETRFVTSIPALCKEPAMSAAVLDAIYEPLAGYENDDDIVEYLRKQYFFDDRDVYNFVDMYKTVLYNYRCENVTDAYISIDRNITMRETLEKYANADEANRERYVVNIEASAEEIFG
ncbi:MAG: extracellular solute-binding protein [Clostridia bacterium]|nr:extracellular solute-binding protein [Clostridia bacterium]